MIYHVTTFVSNPGKFMQMAEWTQKVVAHVREHHDAQAVVLRNVAGSNDEWHYHTTHDSLAAYEAYTMGVQADEALTKMAMEGVGQALWHSSRTSLFRTFG